MRTGEGEPKPVVGIIMGSDSDLPVMAGAEDVMREFGVPYETDIVSAHRTPDKMFSYAELARDRGLKVIIAGAGGAAHLPGMVAAKSTLPVIGVPVESKSLKGMDSLLSIAQMPPGIPVATVAINGARNAGLLAVQILATSDSSLAKKLDDARKELQDMVERKSQELQQKGTKQYLEDHKK